MSIISLIVIYDLGPFKNYGSLKFGSEFGRFYQRKAVHFPSPLPQALRNSGMSPKPKEYAVFIMRYEFVKSIECKINPNFNDSEITVNLLHKQALVWLVLQIQKNILYLEKAPTFHVIIRD